MYHTLLNCIRGINNAKQEETARRRSHCHFIALSTLETEDPNRRTQQEYANLIVGVLIIFTAARPIIHALHHHFFLEPDSVGYLSLGSSIWKGEGFTDFTGSWCSDWPPLYPFFLGFAQQFTHGSVLAMGVVGGVSLAVTLLFSYLWLGQLTRSLTVQCAALAALAYSVPLTNLANSGLSESVFVPLTIVCLYFTGSYLQSGRIGPFLLSAFAALLCCLTRYIGVVVVAAVVVAILFAPSTKIGKKLTDCLVYIALSLLPFFGWCLINKHYAGTYVGERDLGDHTIHECMIALVSCLEDVFVSPWLLFILLIAAAVGLFVWALTREDNPYPYLRTAPLYILFYGAMIVWSSAHFNIDMIDDRLTAPLFVPIVITCVGLIEYMRLVVYADIAKALSVLMAIFFAVCVGFAMTSAQIPSGGYLSQQWLSSKTLAFVRDNHFSGPLLSNDSAAIYLIGHKEADWTADDTDEPTMAYVESQLNQAPPGSYTIWLTNAIEPGDFNPSDIVSKCSMTVVATFNDGYIFEKMNAPAQQTSSL